MARPVLVLGLAAVLGGLLPVGAHATEPGAAEAGTARLERRLATAEAAHLAAQERVDRLTDLASGLAEHADRAAVRAQVLRTRLLTEDRGFVEQLVDLVIPGDGERELAHAAARTQRAAEDAVGRAAQVLADARERAVRAETAWSEAVAELAAVERRIGAPADRRSPTATDIGGAGDRKTVVQRTVVGEAGSYPAAAVAPLHMLLRGLDSVAARAAAPLAAAGGPTSPVAAGRRRTPPWTGSSAPPT